MDFEKLNEIKRRVTANTVTEKQAEAAKWSPLPGANRKKKAQRIVGGIPRDPVNKQSAIVTSKTPKGCEPMGNYLDGTIGSDGRSITDTKHLIESSAVGHRMISKSKTAMNNTEKFVNEVEEAKKRLEEITDVFRAEVIEFTTDEFPAALKKMRDCRMSLTSERAKILDTMKDLRGFFMDKDYDTEIERLERFVRLADRFRKLIDEGTLDSISDAILKLAQ